MNSKKRIAFHTFGCKLNFSETSTISRQFDGKSFEIVDFEDVADIYIIHTCSVTTVAEKKCRFAVKQAHRRNPVATIAVVGCAVQANPLIFSKMEGVKFVLGNLEKFRLAEIIHAETKVKTESLTLPKPKVSNIDTADTFVPSYSFGDRTRSFLKVQDGCDYFCSYCSIPFLRGPSRSETIESTMNVAREIAGTGVKEIVLTGVNIGDFGRQHNETLLQLLLRLEKLEGVERIRISSVEPELLNDEIINLVASSRKLQPHFHIPLQSGSDEVLKLMRRRYPRQVFADRVTLIRQLMPQACIAADVIVGFPGESAALFSETFEFIRQTDITYLHIFTYSGRPGTDSINLLSQVDEKEKLNRSRSLHALSDEKKQSFYRSQFGRKENVLWESDHKNGFMHGFTGNYIKVKTPWENHLVNKITPVIVGNIEEGDVCSVEILQDADNT